MINEGYMPFKDYKTYYRIVNPEGKKTPLILIHGGPGSTHNYFEVFDEFAYENDRPIIMYDQIGCGNSFVDGDEDLFNADIWMEELISLRKYLDLDKAHILGQSWGGMLVILYALTKPEGVESIILSSTLSSAKLWRSEQIRRIAYMDDEYKSHLLDAEKTGNYSSKEYQQALEVFMQRYCAGPYDENAPECLTREKKSGSKSYVVGWGENEFSPTGTLAGYEVTDKLKEIEIPTLITSGAEDLCSPVIAKAIHDNIKNSKWELFPNSRHMPFVDEHNDYIKVLCKWLDEIDNK